ncbi:MAG: RdgB/HAM1 family non-canonical purine NTP pyrophosphatase [Treponema sp.]
MRIYLASSNKHKYQEFKQCLTGVDLVMPSQENIEFSPLENGSTFRDNAMLKAKALYDIVKAPVISDDSGLCVKVLDGKPGIYSARYSTPPSTSENIADYGINRLLKEMEGQKYRDAYFVCCVVLYMEEDRFFIFQDICNGKITESKKGDGGFGYDPIFFIEEMRKTMAELTSEEKNTISHRGKALRSCNIFLKDLANLNSL